MALRVCLSSILDPSQSAATTAMMHNGTLQQLRRTYGNLLVQPAQEFIARIFRVFSARNKHK